MKRLLKKIFVMVCLVGLFSTAALSAGPKMPGPKDRCPVCGMFVAPYPDWIATIVLKDGQQIFFDGCKDLFRYYLELPEGEGEGTKGEITAIYVTEYYRAQFMLVDEVFFVAGSDVYGPMGKELIPVAGKELAETFMRDHSGSQILTFEQITLDLLPPN
ncbi:Nitrous oxide reductase accessory protein NosL [Desulfuromusa kysingii]|uniref:Nitrous oxide reductase accessory protein NosL n=1 Tax=Desulfuromusa kysingii TaxID=37625 RepID=A0A1H3W4X1_9BACT|nr:nitrous oxide reductase accessory protein NosL [Desulfuromusa kysingii]SDZ82169.1 Nitrous oxide reductase accessory protein NosL [Desulfuromusa kysingii]